MSDTPHLPAHPGAAAIRLDRYTSAGFDRGASRLKEALWRGLGQPLLASALPGSGWRAALLRGFGGRIGRGVVIKPRVRVTFPWRLRIGDHCWIGEAAWIDNLAEVRMGAHVCLSQQAYVCTGNHDWSAPTFDLVLASVAVADGAWIAARATLTPGCRAGAGAVLTAGSVSAGALDPFTIYQGVPAKAVGRRVVSPALRPG